MTLLCLAQQRLNNGRPTIREISSRLSKGLVLIIPTHFDFNQIAKVTWFESTQGRRRFALPLTHRVRPGSARLGVFDRREKKSTLGNPLSNQDQTDGGKDGCGGGNS